MWTDSSPEYCANHVRHFFRENGRAISSATGLNFKLWDEKKINSIKVNMQQQLCNEIWLLIHVVQRMQFFIWTQAQIHWAKDPDVSAEWMFCISNES